MSATLVRISLDCIHPSFFESGAAENRCRVVMNSASFPVVQIECFYEYASVR